MKLIIKLLIVVLVFWAAWSYANRSQEKPIISINDSEGNFSVNIANPEKDTLKGIVGKISNFVYREATLHNPPGDMVPDQIDNTLKNEVKEKVN